jgi:6-phosphogluconolactonase
VSDVELVVLETEQDAAHAAAERLAQGVGAGESIVLTGGQSVAPAYEEAARLAPDWSGVEVWWSDERCVPPDDDRSNYGLTERSLLGRLERGPAAVHRIRGELGKDQAAAEYEEELGDRSLDLLLLGLGPDGHLASLFPNAPTLEMPGRVLPAEAGLEPFVDRVTFSLAALCDGRELVFLVTGESKAEAVRRVFADAPSPAAPGSLARGRERTTAILDRAAAANLPA